MENQSTDGQQTSFFWWKESKGTMAKLEALNATLSRLKTEALARTRKNRFHWQLYRNQIIRNEDLSNFGGYSLSQDEREDNLTLNLAKPLCDTMVSKVMANKTRPRVLPEGGSWRDFEKAEKTTKFLDGMFHQSGFYKKAPKGLFDSCVYGTGALKIFRDLNDIAVEKILPQELLVDAKEAVYGEPLTIHEVKMVHREVVKEMFPEHDQAIKDCVSKQGDMIEVRMSWRKRDRVLTKKKEIKEINGNYVVSIETAILQDIKYKKDYFPFVIFKWTDLGVGFFGTGIIEEVADIQIEMNDLISVAQESMHLTEIPKIFAEENSNIDPRHFDDEVGTVIFYRGEKPFVANTGGTSQVLLNQIENLYSKAFEITGVSQLSAQSKKPSGLDAAVAIREYKDTETERFYNVEKRYEDCFIDAAKIMIDIMKDLQEDRIEYKVNIPGQDFLKTIKWKDVNFDEDRYMLEIHSASFLPRTPSGKIAKVQEMIVNGWIGPEQAPVILNMPDIQAFIDRQYSDVRLSYHIIDQMAYSNKYIAPEPFMNLGLSIGIIQRAYLDFKIKGLPESRQDKFRKWLEDADNLLNPDETAGEAAMQAKDAEMALSDQAMSGQAVPQDALPPELQAANPLV